MVSYIYTISVRKAKTTCQVQPQLEGMESSHDFQEQEIHLNNSRSTLCYVCSQACNKSRETFLKLLIFVLFENQKSEAKSTGNKKNRVKTVPARLYLTIHKYYWEK